MKTQKPATANVYIRVFQYKDKKMTKTKNMTVYDADVEKVFALIRAAIERSANGRN